MPRIFDNIEDSLLPALQQTLAVSDRADFSVGYFNLRGWKAIDGLIERWDGEAGRQCRLLVGMQQLPQDELRALVGLAKQPKGLDNQTVLRLKKRLAEDFRAQLCCGAPSNADEVGLRRLARQLKAKKVVVKLYLRHPLHAKLYLCFRSDPVNPIVGYVGSSNLTLSGLAHQGELNVDVMDHDAGVKLSQWFEDRWNDQWCVDISAELVQILEHSWARETLIPPYHIYIKIAYHLAQEARAGLAEFRIPPEFGHRLFDYQIAAVKIAAHHLNKRGGVLIGDVVGLGKTLMASAVAKIFQEDHLTETLIICPKNLTKMWQDYVDEYRLLAKVLSITRVIHELPNLRRYRVVLLDESHNLRNRAGKRYRAIQEYIQENESRCIMLSATPYNKTYLDLSNQLRLFIAEDRDLGIRPERLLKEMGETDFLRQHQCPVRSLAAFEKSPHTDDWRELMRLFMVRRTRSFIQENYATRDPVNGRKFLTFPDGTRSYFPERKPKTVKFEVNDKDANDQYARLYAPKVVTAINALVLPRYGLGNYIAARPHPPPTKAETEQIQDLNRAGQRLKGFCRTNLFKRLESCGEAFQQSIERHILRNYIFLHALAQDLPLPIGTQDAGLLDAGNYDEDVDDPSADAELLEAEDGDFQPAVKLKLRHAADYQARAAEIYAQYAHQFKTRFKWLRPGLFEASLSAALQKDADRLLRVLKHAGDWHPGQDAKLRALHTLLTRTHPTEKVIIFTQFADTARYLTRELARLGVRSLAGVTGESEDPTACAWRFSPVSNHKRDTIAPGDELRVLVATDVLSEGQNLQDAAIIVNFDLPWAIIRLVQRAGRVDRIGQQAAAILCYSFLPADGVENLIRLRSRVRQRLRENAEVVGTDEAFFEDEKEKKKLLDLYHEKAGILDDDDDDREVDLASYAYQIWQNAINRDPDLKNTIPELPALVFATRPYQPRAGKPPGVLAYVRTAEGNDALAWVDNDGKSVTESQFEILRAAECAPETPALPRMEQHHRLVRKGVEKIVAEEKTVGGQLGRPSGARFRTYERLKRYAAAVQGTLFDTPQLARALEDLYRFPLRQSATDTLNRQLRAGIPDDKLADLVLALRDDDRLCLIHEEDQTREPQIICSMGLCESNLSGGGQSRSR